MNSDIISESLRLSKLYNNNIYSLIKDYNIIIKKCYLNDVNALTTSFEDYHIILVNIEIEEKYILNFVIAHEIGHILFDSNNLRFLSTHSYLNHNSETRANLFATIFLNLQYIDFPKNEIDKAINYVICNSFINIDNHKIAK